MTAITAREGNWLHTRVGGLFVLEDFYNVHILIFKKSHYDKRILWLIAIMKKFMQTLHKLKDKYRGPDHSLVNASALCLNTATWAQGQELCVFGSSKKSKGGGCVQARLGSGTWQGFLSP